MTQSTDTFAAEVTTATATNVTATHYDRGYRWLHWSMAVLILLMFLAGFGFADAKTDAEHMTMLIGHSSIGTVLSLLLILRIGKRFVVRSVKPVHPLPVLQQYAAKAVHLGLYACMIFIPVSGYLTASMHQLPVKVFSVFNISQGAADAASEQTFSLLRQAHEYGISLIMLLLVLHIGAALYHQFVNKDRVLFSMLGRNKKVRGVSSE